MAHGSNRKSRVEPEIPSRFGSYRRRRIDAVIDYFGEFRELGALLRIPRNRKWDLKVEERTRRALFTDGPFAETKE